MSSTKAEKPPFSHLQRIVTVVVTALVGMCGLVAGVLLFKQGVGEAQRQWSSTTATAVRVYDSYECKRAKCYQDVDYAFIDRSGVEHNIRGLADHGGDPWSPHTIWVNSAGESAWVHPALEEESDRALSTLGLTALGLLVGLAITAIPFGAYNQGRQHRAQNA
jgi:hypothetical protein